MLIAVEGIGIKGAGDAGQVDHGAIGQGHVAHVAVASVARQDVGRDGAGQGGLQLVGLVHGVLRLHAVGIGIGVVVGVGAEDVGGTHDLVGGDHGAQGLHGSIGQLVEQDQALVGAAGQLIAEVAGAGAQVDVLAILDGGVHLVNHGHFLVQGDDHVHALAAVGDQAVHANLALVVAVIQLSGAELAVAVAHVSAGQRVGAEAVVVGRVHQADGTAGADRVQGVVVGEHGLVHAGLVHDGVGGKPGAEGGNLVGLGRLIVVVHAAGGGLAVVPRGDLVAEQLQAGVKVVLDGGLALVLGRRVMGVLAIGISHIGEVEAVGVLLHGVADLGAGLAGGLVAHQDAGVLGQAEVLIAQGGVQLGADHAAGHTGVLIAEGQGVLHHGHVGRGAEQHGGHHVAAGSQVQGIAVVGGIHVPQDLKVGGGGGDLHGPGGAGEFVVLVVAHRAQDHRQNLVAGHVAGGVEGGGSGALDDLRVVQVAHVARVPGVSADVGEGVAGGVQVHLGGAGVAGHQTVDDGGHFRAGDVARGTEAAAVTLEDAHAGEHFHGLAERRSDGVFVIVLRAGVGGVGGHHQGERHDHRQGQREELFQVSHRNCFLLYIFARISELFSISGLEQDKPSCPPSSILPSG